MKVINNIFKTVILSVILLQNISCGDDDTSAVSNLDLISDAWKISSATINGIPDTNTDYSSYRFTFTTSGSYTLTTGDGTNTGTWEFNSTETAVIVDVGTDNEFTISLLALSEASLIIEFTESGNFKTADQLNNWAMIPA